MMVVSPSAAVRSLAAPPVYTGPGQRRYQEVRSPDITGEQGVEPVRRQLRRRPEPRETGVVHEDCPSAAAEPLSR
jgi:hypothetical protein